MSFDLDDVGAAVRLAGRHELAAAIALITDACATYGDIHEALGYLVFVINHGPSFEIVATPSPDPDDRDRNDTARLAVCLLHACREPIGVDDHGQRTGLLAALGALDDLNGEHLADLTAMLLQLAGTCSLALASRN